MFLFTLTTIKTFILVGYLLIILLVVFFSWLYHTRTIRATRAIGLHAPEYIKLFVKVSITNALITASLIGFLLLTKFY